MKTLSAISIAALLIVALMLSSTKSSSQETKPCDFGGNHTIQVRVGDDNKPVLKYRGRSAENVEVCKKDKVRWVLLGSNREFAVDFADGAPFDGQEKQKSKDYEIDVDISESAEKDRHYAYDVEFTDGEIDPHIIVRD